MLRSSIQLIEIKPQGFMLILPFSELQWPLALHASNKKRLFLGFYFGQLRGTKRKRKKSSHCVQPNKTNISCVRMITSEPLTMDRINLLYNIIPTHLSYDDIFILVTLCSSVVKKKRYVRVTNKNSNRVKL